MKKIITILTCLITFVSVAIAQAQPSNSEAYVNMEEEFARSVIVENEKIAEYAIKIPAGFKSFYKMNAEDVLKWEYIDDEGNLQTGNDGKYLYMDKKRIDAGGKIEVIYDILYDSIRIYYTTPYSIFDLGKATYAVYKIAEDFKILEDFESEDGEIVKKPRYYDYEFYHGNDKEGKETVVKSYKNKTTKKKYTEFYAHIKFKTR